MKNWLRSLKDPVIPEENYYEALNAKTDQEVIGVIEKLPENNRNVLLYVCRLLKYYNTYISMNKMTYDAFAVCISPTLLRMPTYAISISLDGPRSSLDKMDQELNNMHTANNFISKCISLVDINTCQIQSFSS